MSDLNRFIQAIQQLRYSMQAAGMDGVDSISIRLSTRDGFRLEHMIRESGQLVSVAEVKEPVGHSRHVMVANIKLWWLASNTAHQSPAPHKVVAGDASA